MDIERNIVSLKLLGKERKKKNSKVCMPCMCNGFYISFNIAKVRDYAIQVTLSDESMYTVYRSKKQIAGFNVSMLCRRIASYY